MTLQERYNDMTESFTLMGKTYPPRIELPLTVEKLQAFADKAISHNIPILTSMGNEMRKNLSWSGYSLTGNID